jgi:cytochrome c7-like protein
MSGRFRDIEHVIRAVALLAGGFAVFVVVRWVLVPADFGVYGFYRAGALADNQAKPMKYAGQTLCLDCHADVGETRKGSRHATINCEACHGPLARHASGNFDVKPQALNPRLLCLQCHTKSAGKPDFFPQIVPADHGGDGACTECHKPHHPKIE